MRSRFFAWLLTVSLCSTGWGAEPLIEGEHTDSESASPTTVEIWTEETPMPLGVSDAFEETEGCCLAKLGDRYYFQTDFIFWQATDPRENGILLKSAATVSNTVTGVSSLVLDNFSTGTPNTDRQMGFRTFVGRRINENWSVELGGYWLHDNAFPHFAPNLASGRVFVTPLGNPATDPRSLADASSRELSAAALIYEIETHGVELDTRAMLHQGGRLRVDALAGLRYVDYDEFFGSRLTYLNGTVVDEKFTTSNALFGPNLGVETWYLVGEYVSIRTLVKMAFTANFQDVKVAGPAPGNGVLTGAGNLGGSDGTEYATVLETGIGLVGHITPDMQVSFGYDAMWLSTVLRAMDQLDLGNVDNRQPQLRKSNEDVWLRGFNLSFRLNY